MQRLFLLAAALVLCTAPAFAQSAETAPASATVSTAKPGVSVPLARTMAQLYDNGPLQSGTGDGFGGANTSAIQSSYGSTLFGSGHALASTSVADDFVVPAGGWTISDLDFFSYQTGGNATTTTFTGVYVQIWNGRPGDAGSTVVFGDLTTNRLASSTFTNIYRVTETTLTNSQRPIWRNKATIGTTLAAGTYWIQWASTGSLGSGPWVPPVTLAASPTPPPGNARQFTIATSVWADALDGAIVVALPFVVNGTTGTPSGPLLTASPPSANFGTVMVGTTTAPQTITLTNNGTATTTITAITGSGAPFTVNTTGTNLTLAAGATTTFTVTYAPTAAGASTGTVSIASNAPGSPLTIALTGTGNADVTTTVPPGTTVGAPTFNRGTGTVAACTPATGTTGANVAYVTRPFTVATAGSYTITTNYAGNTPSYDGYITLYQGTFNPAASCTNRIAFNDDFGGLTGSQILNQALTAGSYVLVVTGYNDAAAGTFTGTVVGPAAVTFQTTAGEGTARNATSSLSATPNPVRGAARVSFTTATAQEVTVAVYDVTGRQIATLFQGAVAADQTVEASLNAAGLPSGVYVVRATGTDVNLTQRVTVVR